MRILVTGALGFIGTNFVNLLLQEEDVEQIVGFDGLTYAANNIISDPWPTKLAYSVGEIDSPDAVHRALRLMSPTHIVHMAAATHVDRSITDPTTFFQTNVMGTQTLLEQVRHYAPDLKKFIHISTDEVYGPTTYSDLYDGGVAVREFHPNEALRPVSPYAASKAAAEMVCRAYAKTYDMPITILRPVNNYGPYQYTEKFIPKIITFAFKNLPIPVYGHGGHMRDWIYVENTCEVIYSFLNARVEGVWNIGARNYLTNVELARKILDMIPESISNIEFVEDRKAHDLCYGVKTDLAVDMIATKTDLDDGLRKTIAWYRQQYAGKLI